MHLPTNKGCVMYHLVTLGHNSIAWGHHQIVTDYKIKIYPPCSHACTILVASNCAVRKVYVTACIEFCSATLSMHTDGRL